MSRVVSFAVTLLMIGTIFSYGIEFDILEQRDTSYFSDSNNQNTFTDISTWVINPESGPFDSGTEVTISGSGFSSFRSWTISNIDWWGSVGSSSSLAVDSSGGVHVAYINGNGSLNYATYDGSNWTNSTVGDATWGALLSSLVVDSSGDVHISYINGNGSLNYATYDGSNWTNSIIESYLPYPKSITLAVDSSGDVHISWQEKKDLKYATYDGSSWTTSTVSSTSEHSSLALDSSGGVHISYIVSDRWNLSNRNLKYATLSGSNWTTSTVDSVDSAGMDTSLFVDSSGNVHISYLDSTNWGLKYATYDGSSWSTATVDSHNPDYSKLRGPYKAPLAVDSKGNVHISYIDNFEDGDLKYATNDGSYWITTTVDSGGKVARARSLSLAVGSSGDVHISYYINTDSWPSPPFCPCLHYATLSSNSSVNANEITVQFGIYGNVIGTVVDDSTITVTAPQGGCSGEVVDITLWDWNVTSYVLNSAFTYLIPDIDNDGICDMFDSDRDGDGFENIADAFPDDGNENNDTDSDGYGDNGDACPKNHGTSHIDRNGCIDQDGDGVSDLNDAFWMFSSVSAPLSTVMLRVMIVLAVIVAGIVVMIKRRRIKSEEDTSPSNVSIGREQVAAIPESQAEQTQSQVISEYQQWTDEQGHTWRRCSDGRTEWWNGTDWQEA